MFVLKDSMVIHLDILIVINSSIDKSNNNIILLAVVVWRLDAGILPLSTLLCMCIQIGRC